MSNVKCPMSNNKGFWLPAFAGMTERIYSHNEKLKKVIAELA
jgi:hypothetical protein